MTPAAEDTIRHSSELGRWEMVLGEAAPALRRHVTRYWGYSEETFAFSRRRELATAHPVMIVGFGPPIEVSFPSLGSAQSTHAFVAGPSDCPAVVDSFGHQCGVQVDLTALGAYAIFGVPLRELTNRVVDLEDVLGPHAGRLPERLHDASDWPARFAILDEFLTGRMERCSPASPDVAWAWWRLREAGGRVRIGELTDELRCSRRHLSARFGEQVGLPPKTLARLFRFERATGMLGDRSSLSEIALDCGYYDQAHLNRDFREFAGLAPTELEAMLLPDSGGIADACSWPEVAPEFPSVQDGSALNS